MTPERLAEIRELNTDAQEGFACCGRHVTEALGELLAEVERLQHDAELTSNAIQDAVDRYENGVM